MIPVEKVKQIAQKFSEVKLLYLFGSQAENKITKLSDYDFAIYLDEKTSAEKEKEIVLQLNAKLSLILKSNNIDIVVLNKSISPVLKYMVLKEGKIIYQKEPYRLIVEPAIYNEYFDFQVFKRSHSI